MHLNRNCQVASKGEKASRYKHFESKLSYFERISHSILSVAAWTHGEFSHKPSVPESIGSKGCFDQRGLENLDAARTLGQLARIDLKYCYLNTSYRQSATRRTILPSCICLRRCVLMIKIASSSWSPLDDKSLELFVLRHLLTVDALFLRE